jgi:hypothetical protein
MLLSAPRGANREEKDLAHLVVVLAGAEDRLRHNGGGPFGE